jgi:hypothetical protein
LSEGDVSKILADLANAPDVQDSTAYVKEAAMQYADDLPAAHLVAEFHSRCPQKEVTYADGAEVMGRLSEEKIIKILAELEEKQDKVRDATAWVKTAALGAGHVLEHSAGKGAGKRAPLALVNAAFAQAPGFGYGNTASKLIGVFNKRGVAAPIMYKDVAGALANLTDAKIAKILGELELKRGAVRDPTAWVKSAGMKIGGGPAQSAPQMMAMSPSWGMPMFPAQPRGMPAQRNIASKLIGQFNKRGLTAPINYSEVADAVNQLDEVGLFKILSELQEKGSSVRDPTGWVKMAAVRLAGSAGPRRGGRPY